MFTISKQYHFSASHIIEGLPEGHPCSRLHGHNYVAEIVLQSEKIDSIGFIVDYNQLNAFKEIIDELDHRHLNDILPGSTSAESIAYFLYQKAKKMWSEVVAIRISETPKTCAEYRE